MTKTLILSAAVLAFGSAVHGWSQDSRFYVKADLGGNLTQDAELKEFFGSVPPGTQVKFESGFRAGLAGGYQVTDWFAGEVELGFMENRIDSMNVPLSFAPGLGIGSRFQRIHDAWLANVPFLVNGKLQYPNRSPVTPYLGAGVGFSEAILHAGEITLGGTSLHGTAADTVFAYQAFGGLRYKLNDRMGLSLEYRYFAAAGAQWRADFGSGTFGDTMRLGRTQTHALSLVFDFHF